jgi:hypothetical protein
MSPHISVVDRTALKFNQTSIVSLIVLAFILKLEWLVAVVGLVLIAGTLIPAAGAFKLIYAQLFRRFRILHPEIVEEDNTRHLFAQGLGGVFLGFSFISFVGFDQIVVGWSLAFLVAALALVNLTTNFCLGCFLYLRLRRVSFHVKTFTNRITNN